MCGGTPLLTARTGETGGLSPRVRGNPIKDWNNAGLPRSIPACAGEPGTYTLTKSSSKVYPRVCGGTGYSRALGADPAGLSPRVRGNPTNTRPIPGLRGSIPACAGEPAIPLPYLLSGQVYPRVCGGTATTRP